MTLRIGMIAPITHPYPPPGYGPWERVTHDLTERLVADGHDVTLIAPAGAATTARLIETVPSPLVAAPASVSPRLAEEEHLAIAMEAGASMAFDVIHSHLHVHALVFSRLIPCPLVSTLHGAAWDQAHHPLLRRYADLPFVSLSDAEREFLPELNYVATVPNGIRIDDFPAGGGNEGQLAFVGRIAPEKAPHLALEAAARAGRLLLLAGIVETQHQDYFDNAIRPMLRKGQAEYVGSLDRSDLAELLGDAGGLLMPLEWDEPFGLVAVESLAVGTPVIGWKRGAIPEIVVDGETGFLVSSVDEAVAAIGRLASLDRSACRADASLRFSDSAMAAAYAAVYRSVTLTPSLQGLR